MYQKAKKQILSLFKRTEEIGAEGQYSFRFNLNEPYLFLKKGEKDIIGIKYTTSDSEVCVTTVQYCDTAAGVAYYSTQREAGLAELFVLRFIELCLAKRKNVRIIEINSEAGKKFFRKIAKKHNTEVNERKKELAIPVKKQR